MMGKCRSMVSMILGIVFSEWNLNLANEKSLSALDFERFCTPILVLLTGVDFEGLR